MQGQNRIRLDWRLAEMDRDTVRAMVKTAVWDLAKHDLGRVTKYPEFDDESRWSGLLDGGFHPKGTTRMSTILKLE
jgi:hypothetical protein